MKRESILIDRLLLSEDNPRLEASWSEDEAIAKMVEEQNNKLYELASDIVLHGLNPLDTIGVYHSETYNGYYEVGEGNRRVCALKLLINPERIKTINASLYSKFKELSKNFTNPNAIEVGVFEDMKSINHWMEIRHMGEQGGKGLSKWNSVQKARFNRILNGTDAMLDFWDWMIEKDILTYEEIMSVTKTNWQRILRDKYFPFLKIQIEPKYSVLAHDIQLFTERIREVQKNLAGQTVAIVYDQEHIDNLRKIFNGYMHGTDSYPSSMALKNIFKSHKKFIEECIK